MGDNSSLILFQAKAIGEMSGTVPSNEKSVLPTFVGDAS
jgi:hypothetical protein